MDNRPIGVFDSGLGGLTVLKEIIRAMPYENIVYFGDSGRAPYGIKSKETVAGFTFQNIRFLMAQDIKLLVIACNTASAYAYESVKEKLGIPVIEVVRPGSAAAVAASKKGSIGIIGTPATIASKVYENAIYSYDKNVKIISKACTLFVPLVEEGRDWWESDVAERIASVYLSPMRESGIDTLVLGCTHYPVLSKVITRTMGGSVVLISSALEVAREVRSLIIQSGICNDPEGKAGSSLGSYTGAPQYRFFTSDSVEKFKSFGGLILDRTLESVEKINIEDF